MQRKHIREFRQGDIVLIPFLFPSALEEKEPKPRPALVVSSDQYNDFRKNVVLLPLTSRIPRRRLAFDEYLLSQEDLNYARLPKPSIVLFVIMTVDKDKIINRIARLPLKTVEKIISKFKNSVLTGP